MIDYVNVAIPYDLNPTRSFSLRDHILSQAPHLTEREVREHLSFVDQTLIVNPTLDLRRYKISSEGVRNNG